jgi:hypothetical protein
MRIIIRMCPKEGPEALARLSLNQVDPEGTAVSCALSHTCREKDIERRGKDGGAEEWEGRKEREKYRWKRSHLLDHISASEGPSASAGICMYSCVPTKLTT